MSTEKAVQEACDVSKKVYEAFDTGDMEGLFDLMATDVVVKAPLNYADVASKKPFEANSKVEVRTWVEDWMKCFDWTDLRTLQTFAGSAGDEGVYTFNHICYKFTCKKTGKCIECRHEADMLFVKDGKVQRFTEFSDTAEILRICDVSL